MPPLPIASDAIGRPAPPVWTGYRVDDPDRRRQRYPSPLYRDIEDPGEAPMEPVAELVLHPGDVLYVPRGVWHAVSADQGTRSTDLMAWVSEQLLTHEDRRRDLPLLAAPDVQADAVDGMRKRLAELLDDPTLLTRYRAAMDGQPSAGWCRACRTSTASRSTAACGCG
ncbi:JmjC domain-containing protein [Streptomyces sp. NBC_01314]|uniref:JmjC domain-containing protein n=1 Tax=Streptomyces sp. NBC_01314 TaxID=2903821 RepID=UPI00308F29B6|nr:cupin domain-containing protein [Streptomyces sp. NBC_01314]